MSQAARILTGLVAGLALGVMLAAQAPGTAPVSYTHLTLPTIHSV